VIIRKINKIICMALVVSALSILGIGIHASQAADVTLAWDASTSSAVAGYKLYYGLAPRVYNAPIDVGNVTQYKLTGVAEGKNLYFAVTAYDAKKNESVLSTELPCWTIIPSVSGSGSITPAVTTVVSSVTPLTFTFTPILGNSVTDVLVDNSSVGARDSYIFATPNANHTIKAVFGAFPSITGLRIIL